MSGRSKEQKWDTRSVAPNRRFEYWQDAVHSALIPLSLSQRRDEVFSGSLILSNVDRLVVVRGTSAAHVVRRTRTNIARGVDHYFHLLCPVDGAARIAQSGRSCYVEVGDCALLYSGAPFEMEFKGWHQLHSVQIPADLLLGRVGGTFDATAINFGELTGTGASLAALVHAMPSHALCRHTAGQMDLASVLLDLLVIAIRETATGGEPTQRSARVDGNDIVRFIDAHLPDPLLSPAKAARALGVSDRTVHAAMRSGNDSFMSHVRTRRLERIADELLDTENQRVRITDIAFMWGFSDLSTFNRAFRDRYGMAPREFVRACKKDAI